jgi:hypothetical protein
MLLIWSAVSSMLSYHLGRDRWAWAIFVVSAYALIFSVLFVLADRSNVISITVTLPPSGENDRATLIHPETRSVQVLSHTHDRRAGRGKEC